MQIMPLLVSFCPAIQLQHSVSALFQDTYLTRCQESHFISSPIFIFTGIFRRLSFGWNSESIYNAKNCSWTGFWYGNRSW